MKNNAMRERRNEGIIYPATSPDSVRCSVCAGIVFSVIVCLFTGCSSSSSGKQQALEDLKWNYEENTITLNLHADKNLNQFDGEAHSLLLVITQFDKPNAFEAFSSNSQQLSNLLMMEKPPEEMIGLTRIFLNPGQNRQVHLARLEGAKIVGVSAGYAHLSPQSSAKMYPIDISMTSSGWFSKTWTATPSPLTVDLWFGPDALSDNRANKLVSDVAEKH